MATNTENISKQDDGRFKVSYTSDNGDAGVEYFDTFEEANRFLAQREQNVNATPEKAASEMDPEDAEKINSNVHTPNLQSEANDQQSDVDAEDLGQNDDPGTGNREAPQNTKETKNDSGSGKSN
jgi:hypothetical protein